MQEKSFKRRAMKKLGFFLLFLPLWVAAQDFEYWGVRAAYTHTNRSHNLGFVGASLNTEYNWVSRSLYAGVHLGAQNTLAEDGRKQSKMEIVPEGGYEFNLIILGLGASLNTHAFQPRVGLSFFNIYQTYVGYSIPFRRDTVFKGLTFTLVLNFSNAESSDDLRLW